ncbi:MAG TPA: aminotransferase class III-fold pyridoxal phosphate-dependent enzyme [Solirubrobacteraceae bacterium]|nr:aminotransferase class III-fold pyridoxal phosphate-dependent enzyme [Solirubrobacteraceae bacterium]
MTVPQVLHPFATPSRQAGDYLEIVRGEGCRLWDSDGRVYLDGTASLWYCAVGHGRREIADAVAAQMEQVAAYHTFASFTNPAQQRLAELLMELEPIPDARVLFTVTGSEAVDSALKLTRAGHRAAGDAGRTVFLSRHYAYHGVMLGGTSVAGLPANRRPYGPLLGDCFQVERDSLEAMRAAVAYHGPERIAAIITEPVLGAGGVFPPPPGYLQGLRELCDECGALLIFDEVITAFGRLGSWFGAQHFGVTPDVITFAKAITSGYLPLGGVIIGPRLRGWLEADDDYLLTHGGTYAGHPTCCAAGIANLEIMRSEGLPERARHAGSRLRAGLDRLADRPGVAGVRGEGLMQAVALQPPLTAGAMVAALLTRGIISRGLPYANSIAFSPPLVISDGEIDEIVEAVDAALADVAAVV